MLYMILHWVILMPYKLYEEDELVILPCLLHLIKERWKQLSKLGFRKKEYLTNTKLIFFKFKITSIYTFE